MSDRVLRFIVTRDGVPAAVLLSPDDLESLEETVAVLEDEALLESLRTSRREASEGRRLPLQQHV